MPIYQYRCKECSHEIEVLHGIHDVYQDHCAACDHSGMVKCVTAPYFRLSGDGYYETDEKPKAKQRHIATSSESTKSEPVAETTTTSCQKSGCGSSHSH